MRNSIIKLTTIAASFFLLYVFLAGAALAGSVVTYPKVNYAKTSGVFSLTANGGTENKTVFVEDYQDYHYVHFSASGTVQLEVTVKSGANITANTISPKSFGIVGAVTGNKLKFSLSQSGYLVLQIKTFETLERLLILVDPPETNVPASSGTGIFNVRSTPYNADNTGVNNMTSVIQSAINAASAYGTLNAPGVVYVPAGVYKATRLELKNNVILYLAGGAAIKGPTNPAEYQSSDFNWPYPLVKIYDANNVKIKGRGVIDASGKTIYDQTEDPSTPDEEGRLRAPIVTKHSNNYSIEGVIAKDGTSWSVRIQNSHDVSVKNVKVLNNNDTAINNTNDRIDLVNTHDGTVENSFVYTYDDGMCAKAVSPDPDFPIYNKTYNLRFRNNVIWNRTRGMKAGMQAVTEMSDIWFENNDIINAGTGFGVEKRQGGAPMHDIHFIDMRVETVAPELAKGLNNSPATLTLLPTLIVEAD